MSFETRESIIAEIKLCLENDGDLYRNTRRNYEISLLKKLRANKYNKTLAVEGWIYIVESYLRKYACENSISPWHEILSTKERRIVAEQLAEEFHTLALSGEYDGIKLTKKVQFNSKEVQQ